MRHELQDVYSGAILSAGNPKNVPRCCLMQLTGGMSQQTDNGGVQRVCACEYAVSAALCIKYTRSIAVRISRFVASGMEAKFTNAYGAVQSQMFLPEEREADCVFGGDVYTHTSARARRVEHASTHTHHITSLPQARVDVRHMLQ